MLDTFSGELSRNYGFWSEAEQEKLLASDVAVAGVGGDGYLLGLSLVRMGVGSLRVADPEVFEVENINRVPGATHPNLGRRKVDCFAENALAINPDLDITIEPAGVTVENIAGFVSGADLVVDETELTKLELGTMIGDVARENGIPNLQVMNIGFAAQVTSFHPRIGGTFRDMIGVGEATGLDAIAAMQLDLGKVLPFMPDYLDASVFESTAAGAPLPSVVQGVNLASALGTSQAFLHLVEGAKGSIRPEPVWYPEILHVDSLTGTASRTSDPHGSHRRTLERMYDNTRRGSVTPLRYPL